MILDVIKQNFILVADFSHGRILQIDIVTGEMTKLAVDVRKCSGVGFDTKTSELFYADAVQKIIKSLSFPTLTPALVYETGVWIYFTIICCLTSSTGHLLHVYIM